MYEVISEIIWRVFLITGLEIFLDEHLTRLLQSEADKEALSSIHLYV